ncbi:MAG: peptidyl-prolyl cis-trans isomerase [Deltaproteobacteria bacterium]|nr:peptidyl-prolyl cis-trans isomerase [Deltaproteobacteria bacterium]
MHKPLFLAAALALAGCAQPPAEQTTTTAAQTAPAVDIGEVIATVGDIQVGSKEFQMAAARHTPADGKELTLAEKQEILDQLVVEKMLYLEARKKGIDRDPKVQKVMMNTLLRQEVYSTVRNSDFSQEELRAYFDAHQDDFVVPEKVQIKRIFIKAGEARTADEAEALATEIRGKVVADQSTFKELATKHSEDPYRRRGGDLGFVAKDGKPGVDQAVVDKAFGLEVNQVSEVFEADGGYNVVLVANRRERVERTFEQMKGSVLRKVKSDKYKDLYDGYVAGIRDGYKVSVDENTLGAVEIEQARRLTPHPMGMRPGADDEEPEGAEPGEAMPGEDE